MPGSDKLIVEARVAPPDIDQVFVGATTMVRVMAGNQRITPEVMGMLTYISADLTRELQNNQTYYVVRVALSEDDVRRLGSLKVVPGMLAEIFIQTEECTPLQYLPEATSRTDRSHVP